MTDPDDAQLSALLRQGRSSMPRPSDAFRARVIRAYSNRFANRSWRRFFSLKLAVPVPMGAAVVLALLALGFAMGAKSRFSVARKETVQQGSKSKPFEVSATDTEDRVLGGFQVVAELRPRIIGGSNEGR